MSMFKSEDFKSRAIDIELENLTSGVTRRIGQKEVISLLELQEESVTLTLVAPLTTCASGHHLKVKITLKEVLPIVHFIATGVARDVEKAENGLKIVFQPLQYDKKEWARLLTTLQSSFEEVQSVFKAIKG